jgi:hypothetical protein
VSFLRHICFGDWNHPTARRLGYRFNICVVWIGLIFAGLGCYRLAFPNG